MVRLSWMGPLESQIFVRGSGGRRVKLRRGKYDDANRVWSDIV